MGAFLTNLRQINLATPIPYQELPIHRLFENQLVHHAEKPALTYLDIEKGAPVTVTYRYLNKASNKCARVLIKIVTEKWGKAADKRNTIIATCMQPSLFFAIIHLAIWKAGATYLTIDPNDENIEQIRNDANAQIVIYDNDIGVDSLFNKNIGYDAQTLIKSSYQENSINLTEDEMLSQQNLNSIATIMFTTAYASGERKGVLLTHKSLLNRLFWQWDHFPYKNKEHIALFQTPCTCVESIYELWGPLISGLTVLVLSRDCRNQPLFLLQILEEYRIQRVTLMPNILANLIYYLNNFKSKTKNRRKRNLKKVKLWFCTGDQLSQLTILQFYEYFDSKQKLYCFYGCTEVAGDFLYLNCKSDKALDQATVPLGTPIANTEIYLLNNNMKQVENGEVGELCVSGSSVATGYLKDNYNEAFVDNPFSKNANFARLFRTGDLCRKLNGNILFVGRKDNQINFGGQEINLTEIEQCFMNYPLVEKSIVIFYGYKKEHANLLAFVKLFPNTPVEAKDHLNDEMRKLVPTSLNFDVVMLSKFPMLASGKVDRQMLYKCYRQVQNSKQSSVLGVESCDLNAEMCIIYEDFFKIINDELLNINKKEKCYINFDTNFFDVGGTQMNAISAVRKLRNKGYVVTLFQFVTARKLGDVFKIITDKASSCSRSDNYIDAFPHLNIVVVRLQESNRVKMIRLITDMTIQTGDMQNTLFNARGSMDYRNLLNEFWNHMDEFSFVVLDAVNENILGFSLNFVGTVLPNTSAQGQLDDLLNFYEFLIEHLRTAYLIQTNSKIMFSVLMTTSSCLKPTENIAVLNVMESEKMRLALAHNFTNLLWINSDPLTQIMSCDFFYYKILLDYQINRYNSKYGAQPFAIAPESDRIFISWKIIGSKT